DQTESAARIITPAGTIWPGRESSDQQKHEDNQQECSHSIRLFGRTAKWQCLFPRHDAAYLRPMSGFREKYGRRALFRLRTAASFPKISCRHAPPTYYSAAVPSVS